MSLTLFDIMPHFHKVQCSCGTLIGQAHIPYCDIARCLECGGQAAWCGDEWNPDTWTGWWPGTIDCIRFGFYSKWDGPQWPEKGPAGKGWVPCEKDDPKAGADLNRLMTDTFWDPCLQMRVLNNMPMDDYKALYEERGIEWKTT